MRLTQKDDQGNWSVKGCSWMELWESNLSQKNRDVIYGAFSKLLDYEEAELDPDEVEELKHDRDDWQQEARRQCAAAGELRIAIAERLEEIRTNIMTTKQQLAIEENHFDQVILKWKIGQLQQQADWLEKTLAGGRTCTEIKKDIPIRQQERP